MANWYGIEGIKHIYRGDYSDPLVEYKGMRWTEWEVEAAAVEDYKYAIKDGDIDENMTFEEYAKEYADYIKGMLDDWIWSQQENKDNIQRLKNEALSELDDLVSDMTETFAYRIIDWANTDEKLLQTVEAFSIEANYDLTDPEELDDYRNLDFEYDICTAKWNDLSRFAEYIGIQQLEPFIVYLQNETALPFRDKETLLKGLGDLAKNKNTEGLYMIVCGMGKDGGEVKFEGVACEQTANEARVALNGAEHKNEVER